jgi:two-component system NtrC family sensor kinase
MMNNRNRVILSIAGGLCLLITVMEVFFPLNVVGAYGFVLPILLVATVRNRKLMYITLLLCVVVSYGGLFQPTKKKERFTTVVINRTMVVCVLIGVAYIGMTWEERKAREEAARTALAKQTENLLQANAQLVEMKDRLYHSERLAAVGQLVASVAHEVGTPLHSIAWHVQALAEEPGATPEMKKRIDIVDTQLNRVVRIIQDLLSSTRQRNPEPSWTAPGHLVQPVVALMEPAFHAKHIALKVEEQGALPLAWADVEKIHQVLINLLTNALVATGGGGTVTVRLGSRPASPDESQAGQCTGRDGVDSMVLLAIHDTGCGMPPEDLQRAFEPFFTTKAHGKGTGLGLFLSRETILAHGGGLTIDSEVGKGTVVTVVLPGWRADAEAVG